MNELKKTFTLAVLTLIFNTSCTLSAPNAKIDANVDQSTQKGTSSNDSNGKSGSNGNSTPQQIVVNVNNNPNINTNVNPNLSNSSNNSQDQTTNNNNANNPNNNPSSVSPSSPSTSGSINNQTNSEKKYKIVFSRGSSTTSELFTMNSDGSNQTQLTKNQSLASSGASCPADGSKIVYENVGKIFVINSDGSSNTQLTGIGKVDYQDKQPNFSFDGKKIVFKRDYNIWTMNSDGSEQTKITDNAGGDSNPKWSPDNKKIGFISQSNGKKKLFLMNADGSEKTEFLGEGNYNTLIWSPDGKQILFGLDGDIYSINSDGKGGQINLTKTTDNESFPSISHDGMRIIYKFSGEKGNGIYVMNFDGSNQMSLTNEARDTEPTWL